MQLFKNPHWFNVFVMWFLIFSGSCYRTCFDIGNNSADLFLLSCAWKRLSNKFLLETKLPVNLGCFFFITAAVWGRYRCVFHYTWTQVHSKPFKKKNPFYIPLPAIVIEGFVWLMYYLHRCIVHNKLFPHLHHFSHFTFYCCVFCQPRTKQLVLSCLIDSTY